MRFFIFVFLSLLQLSCSSEIENSYPLVNAGEDIEVFEGEEVTLKSVSSDDDGHIEMFEWTYVSGAQIALSNINQPNLSFVSPSTGNQESVLTVLRLKVTDNAGASAFDDVSIVTLRLPTPPIVDTGEDIIVRSGDEVTLDSISSFDQHSERLDYHWSVLEPSYIELTFFDNSIEHPTFIAPNVTEKTNVILNLEVTDDDLLTSNSELTITIIPTSSRALNDTGYIYCANNAGNNFHWEHSLDCGSEVDSNGWVIPIGQDGHTGLDSDATLEDDGRAGFSFTKLDSQGKPLPWNSENWSCVRDNNTGYIWEGRSTPDENLYTWYNSNYRQNGGDEGSVGGDTTCDNLERCDTQTYTELANSESYCGFDDWKVPTHHELATLVDLSKSKDIYKKFFTNIIFNDYWSSTSLSHNNKYARTVNLEGGFFSSHALKANENSLMLVYNPFEDAVTSNLKPFDDNQECNAMIESAFTNERFEFSSYGTVVDKITRLEWAIGHDQQYYGNWFDSLESAQNSTYAGKSDWRMPNIKELYTLIERACVLPSINRNIFPNLTNTVYWSSTPISKEYGTIETVLARVIEFNYGTTGSSTTTARKMGDAYLTMIMVRTADQ